MKKIKCRVCAGKKRTKGYCEGYGCSCGGCKGWFWEKCHYCKGTGVDHEPGPPTIWDKLAMDVYPMTVDIFNLGTPALDLLERK